MDLEFKPKKAFTIPDYGNYDDLLKRVDPAELQIIPVNDVETLSIKRIDTETIRISADSQTIDVASSANEEVVRRPKPTGSRKQIQVQMLFGPHKTAFRIPSKREKGEEKKRFSHKRIFGQQKMKFVNV